jgi:hypothetical protein
MNTIIAIIEQSIWHESTKPRRKKTKASAAMRPTKPQAAPRAEKPKVDDASKELGRIADAEQVRLANVPNKHIKNVSLAPQFTR